MYDALFSVWLILKDEVDSLGQTRGSSDDPVARRLLTELLIQMSAVQTEEAVYVLAATNRMQVCVLQLSVTLTVPSYMQGFCMWVESSCCKSSVG